MFISCFKVLSTIPNDIMSALTLTKFPCDNEMAAPRYSAVNWDDIPTEIFIYIFKKLNITSLRCCFAVSRKWREIAMCVCDTQDLWQPLVEHGMVWNLKSTLSWKELYFNSSLWTKLPSAVPLKLHQVEKSNIRNIHVYRDKVIVVDSNGYEYYDIESLQVIRTIIEQDCVDVQESDHMLMVVTETDDSYNKVAIFLKLDKDWDMSKNVSIPAMELGRGGIHSFFGCLCWRLAGNRAYVIDASGVLWECCAIDRDLTVTASAKYYGLFPRTANSPIHLTGGDVYVSINCGNLVTVTKDSMMFRKVKMTEIPTKVIENFKKTKTPCREGFNTFNAFIKFPLDTEFVDRSTAPLNMIHYHYVDPDMTCALQLGDVVFQGFVDGEIKITLLRNYFKLNFNVKQFDQDEVNDCAVTALDIYEMKGMHKLMVATKHKLYAILLKYTELRTSDWMES